jgi:hypothetical protein
MRIGGFGLVGLTALGELASAWGALLNPKKAQAANAIQTENALPGTNLWELGKIATDTGMEIKGYASATSVNKGGSVDLFISVNPPQTYTIDVYRIGWYAGEGSRAVLPTIGPLDGITQSIPAPDASTGMVECRWAKSFTLALPADLVSGIYLIKLTNADGFDNYIHLVVRDDAGNADLLFQSSVTTYQAYNPFGGKSLYSFSSTDSIPAVKVSFDRPYADNGCGDFLYWELGMVRFLEMNGYNISYCTNLDVQTTPGLFAGHKGFLSVGHDEYWTKQMFDNVLAARNAGTNLAFFSANTIYWQVRFENSSRGVANRVMVGYKDSYTSDPMYGVNNSLVTNLFRDPTTANRPENQLIGVMFDSYYNWDQGYAYKVRNSTHWVYAGTSFTNTSSVRGLVGYEWDSQFNNGVSPAGATILSASPVTDVSNTTSTANSTIYQATSGAWVFSAGSIYWTFGCDFNSYQTRSLVNAGIRKATQNILNTFVASTTSTPTPTPTATAIATPTSPPTPTSTPTVPAATPTSTPTATATATVPGPTSTPTPTVPGPTSTPTATATATVPGPTSTPTATVPGPTSTPTSTPKPTSAATPTPTTGTAPTPTVGPPIGGFINVLGTWDYKSTVTSGPLLGQTNNGVMVFNNQKPNATFTGTYTQTGKAAIAVSGVLDTPGIVWLNFGVYDEVGNFTSNYAANGTFKYIGTTNKGTWTLSNRR